MDENYEVPCEDVRWAEDPRVRGLIAFVCTRPKWVNTAAHEHRWEPASEARYPDLPTGETPPH